MFLDWFIFGSNLTTFWWVLLIKLNIFVQDIPLQQRLYVLEDIDCADLKNIVSDREKRDKQKKLEHDGEGSASGMSRSRYFERIL